MLTALGIPDLARADHHFVFIHGVQKLSSTACAVELWISADGQDAFEGVDRITVDGVLLASLGDAAAGAINAGGHVDTGDSILFASQAFQDGVTITADVTFPNSACAGFDSDSVFEFLLDDVDFGGPDTVIDTLTAESPFGDNNTALAKASASADPVVIDLTGDSVSVANNAGAEVTIGEEPAAPSSSGGCSLIR
jgi:hypothetical protein